MKMGAEPRKVALLAILGLGGAYSLYTNVFSSSDSPSTPAPKPASGQSTPYDIAPQPTASLAAGAPSSVRRNPRSSSSEFKPKFRVANGEQRDPMTVDPTLRLDLLAKVQAVEITGGGRNVFQVGQPPPPPLPKTPEAKITPGKGGLPGQMPGGMAVPPPGPPKPPPEPPINLKYYGFAASKADGKKKAFFLDGEIILIAAEGETVMRRYKVVRIGVNSVVMEDVDSKKQQAIPLQEDVQG